MIGTGARPRRGTEARAGALWGLAFGDARCGGGDLGPALAVWDALAAVPGGPTGVDDTGEPVVLAVLDHLLSWYADQPCGAPAPTLGAIRRNGDPASWVRLAVPERSRAGVVRAAWLGVHPDVPRERLAALAQAQTLATDSHPVSPVAAEVAAALTAALASGQAVPGRAAAWVRAYVGEARTRRPGAVLEGVAGVAGAAGHLAAGWAMLVPRLCGTDGRGPKADPAESADGADGALATALRVLDTDPAAPAAAVERLASPHGSPSAAALLGVFLGAAHGPSFGTDWVGRLAREDREALTLRECGGAPRRYAGDWRLRTRTSAEEATPDDVPLDVPVGAPVG